MGMFLIPMVELLGMSLALKLLKKYPRLCWGWPRLIINMAPASCICHSTQRKTTENKDSTLVSYVTENPKILQLLLKEESRTEDRAN